MTKKLPGGLKRAEIVSLTVSLAFAAMLAFIPIGTDVDLLSLSLGGYLLLFVAGAAASCTLVVPGISGSMILLILGYYNPIINLITNHFFMLKDLGKCILVLGSCGLGIAVGFFIISLIMKHLLAKHPRKTYAAIVGFIIGSLPTVYISTMKSVGMITQTLGVISLPTSAMHYAICVFLLIAGACASLSFAALATKRKVE